MRDTASCTVASTWAMVWPWSKEVQTASAKVRSWGSVGANSGMRWWRAAMAAETLAVVKSTRWPGGSFGAATVVAGGLASAAVVTVVEGDAVLRVVAVVAGTAVLADAGAGV